MSRKIIPFNTVIKLKTLPASLQELFLYQQRRNAEMSGIKASLQIVNMVLGNFIGDALNNRLTAMAGYLELIEDDPAAPDARRHMRTVREAMQQLIKAIHTYQRYTGLDFSELEESDQADLGKIFSLLLNERELQRYDGTVFHIPENINISMTDRPSDGPLMVKGKEDQLRTALMEILINAVESFPEAKTGKIVVAVKIKGEILTISIADQGIGMKSLELPRCELPFYKTPMVKTSGRFGLGTYLANQAVKHCGGELKIESSILIGTTVTIKLPLVHDQEVPRGND
jgi:signal transduction histidine kinase